MLYLYVLLLYVHKPNTMTFPFKRGVALQYIHYSRIFRQLSIDFEDAVSYLHSNTQREEALIHFSWRVVRNHLQLDKYVQLWSSC